MYQPTLGRFLSRDPLSENGVDVLTDTGFYSNRLAAMSSNPWFYGGNWEHPYVYSRNNPATWADPSGLQVGKWGFGNQGYFGFCNSVCAAAATDPELNQGCGGVLCKEGIKCVCQFTCTTGKKLTWSPGACKTLDACLRRHERQHLVDIDCPRDPDKYFIITRPGFKKTVNNPKERECLLRKNDVVCLQAAINDLEATNTNGCNKNCINVAQGLIKDLQIDIAIGGC